MARGGSTDRQMAICFRYSEVVGVKREPYVEQREGGYFIAGTRVSLDSVVCAFLRGESPEGIAESFPALHLEQVFGALAFYLANRQAVDEYLRQGQRDFETLRQQSRRRHPALYARLDETGRGTRAPGA
jgi:uncharacterized protein (DUF433 family)